MDSLTEKLKGDSNSNLSDVGWCEWWGI